ncbi:coatomer subunit delta-like isoform X2 [Beta vulgaris subsp. vulgaris]|uniref:coatomer subunit delta-like isoform X2 n=2 Tax=Beta vulgaris subsp. vulgaris TaxID=3555 RepID=UPI00203756E6|nr:coatomer subunit delta-like isoform X2 [Beta vulgaris subsp. vulgaris]
MDENSKVVEVRPPWLLHQRGHSWTRYNLPKYKMEKSATKEAISILGKVKQYCEMECHEKKLHKLVIASKINETKDIMKRKASEIEKSKIEKNRGDKGGYMSSMGSGRLESTFGDMSISSSSIGFGSGSGFGMSTDLDSFPSKSKGVFYLLYLVVHIIYLLTAKSSQGVKLFSDILIKSFLF